MFQIGRLVGQLKPDIWPQRPQLFYLFIYLFLMGRRHNSFDFEDSPFTYPYEILPKWYKERVLNCLHTYVQVCTLFVLNMFKFALM